MPPCHSPSGVGSDHGQNLMHTRQAGIKRGSFGGPATAQSYFEITGRMMSRVCQVTGKRPASGNNVSHANNKTRRRFLPNLHSRRFWSEAENRWIRLRVSTKGLRIIDKKGFDTVLGELRANGVKV